MSLVCWMNVIPYESYVHVCETSSNLKEEIRKNTTQLADKITDTCIHIDTLEIKEQRALHEQAVRL